MRRGLWNIVAGLAWLMAVALSAVAVAAEAEPASTAPADREPLHYRRVYAPASRVGDWPRGTTKYLPIARDEFERLLSAANMATPERRPTSSARIAVAEYSVRLNGAHLTGGTAKLRIDVSTKTPAILPMEPCNLAIQDLKRESADSASPILGLGADGELTLLARKSASLDLDWSLEGRAEVGGGALFDVQLPPCSVNTFTIDAQEGLLVTSDRGMLRNLGFVDEGVERWQIDLGGNSCFQIKTTPIGRTSAPQRLAKVIQSTLYDISLKGVEVSCQWRLDVHNEPLHFLALRIDGKLQITSATIGNQPLPFTVNRTSKDETEVVVAFPVPIDKEGCVLQLKALSPMDPGLPCALPRIRPQDVFWQDGEAELAVHAPLQIESLSTTAGRQVGTASLTAPTVGQSYRFQSFSPEASIEATFGVQQAALAVTSATTVELSLSTAAARIAADLRSTVGDHFTIEAEVGDKWLIDSVESQPADAIDNWSVERNNGKSLLTIRLTTPVTPQRSLRLVAIARRPGTTLEDRFSPEGLMPLSLRAAASKQLLALRAIAPCRLQLSGGEGFTPTLPQSLDAIQRDLLSDAPRDVLLEPSSQTANLRIRVAPQQPTYAGTIRLDASIHDDAIEEQYVIHCKPESGAVDRLQVTFTTQRAEPLRWTLANPARTVLTASRLPNMRAETWEVILPEPASEPFDLCAVRRIPSGESAAISLASLPDAASQRATAALHCLSAAKPKVINNRLQPVPAEPSPQGQDLRLLGTYRYDPVVEAALAQTRETEETAPALSFVRGIVKPKAFVWSLELESWFGYESAVRHTATFRVQNSGLGEMKIELPGDSIAESCDVQVDGRNDFFRPEEAPPAAALRVRLDEDRRYATVVVHFSTPFHGLRTVGSVTPPSLKTDLTVFAKTWTAWLPPDYAWHGGNPCYLAVEPPTTSTAQRLFGPLGRDNDDPACNPLKPATWAPAIARRAAQEASIQITQQWLQSIGAILKAESRGITWGDLLGRSPGGATALLIDHAAMTRLEITPQTIVAVKSATASNRAAEAIQSAGLALIVHPRAVLVTGQVEAALWHGWLQDGPRSHLWSTDSGPLSGQIEQAATSGDSQFTVADIWRRQLPEAKAVWNSPPADTSDAASGWAAVHTVVVEEEPVCLSYANVGVMRLLGVAVFVVVLAAGWPIASRHRRWLGVAVCATAAVALLASEPFLPAATGAFLGLIACLAVGVLRKSPGSPVQPAAAKRTPNAVSINLPTATTALLLCVTTALPASARGGETSAPRHDYQVFIPVDENQRPTNDKYQISEDFFHELYRRAQTSAETPHGWILSGASYRGALVKDEANDRYRIDQLTAVFDLYILGPKTRVRIPIHREGANLAAEGASLDGEEIQVDWEPDGDALAFDVATAGVCRLELVLRGVGLADGFEASIPRLASSSLELTVPPGMPSVEVPTALGAVEWKSAPRRLSAALGPTDRLSVRWGNGGGPNNAAPAVDVEQLQWMRVLPGSLTLDVKWKIKVMDGRLRQLQIAADPRLRLLPLTGDHAPQYVIRPAGLQSQSIILSWKTPIRDETVVEARFLLPGASGVGTIRPPRLDVLDARTTRRMLAVSVDRALEFEQEAADRAEPVAPDEFLAAWGKSSTVPLLTLRPIAGDAFWRLITRPCEAKTTVEQTLAVAYGENHAQLLYDAQLVTTGGSHFQIGVTAPPQLQIDRVSLLVEGLERVDHWSRSANGEISVFLKEAATGRQTFSLRGRLPATIDTPQVLPDLHVQQSQLLSSTIQVYRLGSVLATVMLGRELTAMAPASLQAQAEFGRLVQAFRIDPAVKLESTVQLTPNRPKVRTEQVVWVRRSADAWTAQCDNRLRVSEGELDDLRIQTPLNFAGPLRLGSGISARIANTAGDSRMLVVHPEAAIRGEVFLSVTGVLGPTTGDRFIAPQFVPQKVEHSRRLLALPKLLNSRPVAWDTIGMRPTDLPTDFPQPADIASFDFYEVIEEPCKAVLNVSDQSLGTARVRLCDVTAAWQDDGSVRGVAAFDVEPGKAIDCPLWLPQGLHMVFCSVAGIAVEPMADSGGTLRIPFAMARLPQRVEVVFEGMPPQTPGSIGRLEAPTLGDLPVDQTLWTVIGPAACMWTASDGGEAVAAWQVEMTRLKSLAALGQSAIAQSNIAPEDLVNWYEGHAVRLAATRRSIERLLSDAPRKPAVRMARLEVRTIDQEQMQLAERLGTTATLARANAATSAADTPNELLGRSLAPGSLQVWFSARGRIDSLKPHTVSSGPENAVIHRMLGAVMAIAVACFLMFATPSALAWPLRVIRQRPYAAGIVVGLAWWLWLCPSWLGWVMIAACIVRFLQTGRRLLAMEVSPDPAPDSPVQ